MARTSTKSVNEEVAVVNPTATDISVAENKNEEEVVVTKNISKVHLEPLDDSDEIDIVSLIPNVSYKDSKTGDMYEWEEVDHIEPMTFETLKNMWRNHKGYFRNMWLKPLDERVINKFGLTKTFEKYDFLMDESNYNRSNIQKICSTISDAPNELKYSLVNKIKNMIIVGELSDIAVIRSLEKHFNLDLVSFLN